MSGLLKVVFKERDEIEKKNGHRSFSFKKEVDSAMTQLWKKLILPIVRFISPRRAGIEIEWRLRIKSLHVHSTKEKKKTAL